MRVLLALMLVIQSFGSGVETWAAWETPPHLCAVQTVDGHKAYVCAQETPGEQAPVSKTWFAKHCNGDSVQATCDAFAPAADVPVKDRAAPGSHKVRNIALGALVVVIIASCAASGGCAALGGG